MKIIPYNNQEYNINQLSHMSGISPATIRDRLRRGYSVEQAVRDYPIHDSVKLFTESSCYDDWIGMSTSYLYEIYCKWSVSSGYTPIHIKGFTRQILNIYPNLRVIPSRVNDRYARIIRER